MANEHTTLSSLFTAIANAIRSKTGSSASIVADKFPDAISAIATGSGGIDTSGATATAEDIAEGKTAYVSTGMVTGNVLTTSQGGFFTSSSDVSASSSILTFKCTLNSNRLFRSGSSIRLSTDLVNLGDATAADVAAGKTFTSAAGLKVTGTHEGNVEACGQYIWEKSKPTEWGVTSTDLGTTKPSDCGTTRYGTATITDDGHYTLSGTVNIGGYYYIKGTETNPKSVYCSTWHYVHNGDSYYTYEKLTISDAPVSEGRMIGYVVSDDEAAYPDGGTQDGYWYVRVTVQEV